MSALCNQLQDEHTGEFLSLEDGAAYSLSVVMVTPIYALLMCLILESTLVLVAKIGTVYAGFAAVRSASVWCSATDDQAIVQEKFETAAHRSFTPFASGTHLDAADLLQGKSVATYVARLEAYRLITGKSSLMPVTVLARKHANSRRFLTVRLREFPKDADSELTIDVEYRFRFNVPGIARLLGRYDQTGDYYYLPIQTSVTLHNEGPQNLNQDMGIGYGKFE